MKMSLEERISCIIDDSDFNDLPFEERKRIGKYLKERQILTLWQTLKQYPNLTTEAWRKKQRELLKGCVKAYEREYGRNKEYNQWTEHLTTT